MGASNSAPAASTATTATEPTGSGSDTTSAQPCAVATSHVAAEMPVLMDDTALVMTPYAAVAGGESLVWPASVTMASPIALDESEGGRLMELADAAAAAAATGSSPTAPLAPLTVTHHCGGCDDCRLSASAASPPVPFPTLLTDDQVQDVVAASTATVAPSRSKSSNNNNNKKRRGFPKLSQAARERIRELTKMSVARIDSMQQHKSANVVRPVIQQPRHGRSHLY